MMSLRKFLLGWVISGDPVGLEAILSHEAGAGRIVRALSMLCDLGGDLVLGVTRAFLYHVADVPASEHHHHSEPFGLFDHSLEVAELALYAAQAEPFASCDEQEYRAPRFRFASWFFGLLHDAGKIAHVTVREPAGAIWNPYLEPLADFYVRHSRSRCTLAWQRGRGLDAHKLETPYIVGKLMAPPVVRFLGPTIIREVIDQQTPDAMAVRRLIAAADQESAREAMARQARVDHRSGACVPVRLPNSGPPAVPPPSSGSRS